MYDQIRSVVDTIVKTYLPAKVVLFGSYAWGKPDAHSDVDLLIVKETENTRELSRRIGRTIFPRPFPMDLIVYTPQQLEQTRKSDFFVREMLEKGTVLYGR